MTNRKKWLIALAAVFGAIIALAAGVPFGTLLIVGALLLCPAAMYFGMQGMSHGSCHDGDCRNETNTPQAGGNLNARARE